MYAKSDASGYVVAAPGILRKTLVHGDHTMMTRFLLTKGALLPRHSHPEEQTGCLISGHMILTIGNDAYEIHPGDSWTIPGNVEHHAKIVEDSVALEVFSPPRGDYR
ncbi:MAG: cupin domain-containing protein [Methanomicrobiales archaeon]|nr:cupin domain-containing protein [Methanomicrobiales archaeon]